MNQIILEVSNITKIYQTQKALDQVSFKLEKGKVYGFIGQNGSGKTTLMRVITGIAFPNSGEIKLFNESNYNGSAILKTKVGSLIEEPALYPSLSARDNLEAQRITCGNPDLKIVEEVLQTVNLKDTGKKKVKNFSLGMKQRLGIAMALINRPEFLILDEPINGLDAVSILEIRELIHTLNTERGITIFISSHILNELYQVATDFIFIDNGRVIEQISHDELNKKCRKSIVLKVDQTEIGATIIERELGTTNFMVTPDGSIHLYDYLDNIEHVSRTLSANGLTILKIDLQGENLENYFLNMIGAHKND